MAIMSEEFTRDRTPIYRALCYPVSSTICVANFMQGSAQLSERRTMAVVLPIVGNSPCDHCTTTEVPVPAGPVVRLYSAAQLSLHSVIPMYQYARRRTGCLLCNALPSVSVFMLFLSQILMGMQTTCCS